MVLLTHNRLCCLFLVCLLSDEDLFTYTGPIEEVCHILDIAQKRSEHTVFHIGGSIELTTNSYAQSPTTTITIQMSANDYTRDTTMTGSTYGTRDGCLVIGDPDDPRCRGLKTTSHTTTSHQQGIVPESYLTPGKVIKAPFNNTRVFDCGSLKLGSRAFQCTISLY